MNEQKLSPTDHISEEASIKWTCFFSGRLHAQSVFWQMIALHQLVFIFHTW